MLHRQPPGVRYNFRSVFLDKRAHHHKGPPHVEPSHPFRYRSIGTCQRRGIVKSSAVAAPYFQAALVTIKGPAFTHGVTPARHPIENDQVSTSAHVVTLCLLERASCKAHSWIGRDHEQRV